MTSKCSRVQDLDVSFSLSGFIPQGNLIYSHDFIYCMCMIPKMLKSTLLTSSLPPDSWTCSKLNPYFFPFHTCSSTNVLHLSKWHHCSFSYWEIKTLTALYSSHSTSNPTEIPLFLPQKYIWGQVTSHQLHSYHHTPSHYFFPGLMQ